MTGGDTARICCSRGDPVANTCCLALPWWQMVQWEVGAREGAGGGGEGGRGETVFEYL